MGVTRIGDTEDEARQRYREVVAAPTWSFACFALASGC